ncbi:MAG: hypothetical protein Q4C96_11335 [Planctomycetia bacterium]|nr:hypothetical protein [Planctomycetia bacterium]
MLRHFVSFYWFPGLPQFYYHGSLMGWGVVMVYTFFAMFVVSATFVWEEIIPASARVPLWGMFFTAWMLGVIISWRLERQFRAAEEKKSLDFERNDTLPEAQSAYLRRDWFQAEYLLQQRISLWPEDVPARVLFLSLLRRLKRFDEAKTQLKILSDLSVSGAWRWEIHRLEQWIQQDENADAEE